MTSKFKKFRALSASERLVLGTAWVAMPLFWLALRMGGFPRLQTRLNQRGEPSRPPSGPAPAEVARLVNLAAHYSPFPANCLTRSMLLLWMLRRRGADCRLRIGVRPSGGALDAHAWVELGGLPLNDTHDVADRFAPFEGSLSSNDFHDASSRWDQRTAK